MPLPGDCPLSLQDPALLSGLDQVNIGLGLFDEEQLLLFCNQAFRDHGGYPAHLCSVGAPLVELERLDRQCRSDRGRHIDRKYAHLNGRGRIIVSLDVTDYQCVGQDSSPAEDVARPATKEVAPKTRSADDAERLAALGELTAGVAHEIKNPLNFINNFAHVSLDLMDEAIETLAPAMEHLDPGTNAEIKDLFGLVRQNFVKINQHGRRADSIVRTMLMHARQRPDKTQTAPLNTLVEEAVTLAKQDLEFASSGRPVNVTASLSADIGSIECFPEDLVRALINLIANGIDAARRNNDQVVPAVNVMTEALGDNVEITIQDNGIGMPEHVLDQALTPFFTTKPPGEGTGLGLSLCHDVISRQHRGQMAISSEPQTFTKVVVTLFKHLPERRNGGRRRDDG